MTFQNPAKCRVFLCGAGVTSVQTTQGKVLPLLLYRVRFQTGLGRRADGVGAVSAATSAIRIIYIMELKYQLHNIFAANVLPS